MTAVEVPFEIGSTWWKPIVTPTRKEVPCPVCCGNRAVVVILGDGEQVGVECDACGRGAERPRGVVTTYSYSADAQEVRILRLVGFQLVGEEKAPRWRVEVESEGCVNRELDFAELRATRGEAMDESVATMDRLAEEAAASRAAIKKDRLGRYAWSVAYHRDQIKELERSLAWHRAKLAEKDKRQERPFNFAPRPQGHDPKD